MKRAPLLVLLLLLVVAPLSCSLPKATAASTSATVPGTADLWLAGVPPGIHDSNTDAAPEESPVFVPVTAGLVLTFDVSGAVGDTANSENTPDGNSAVIATHRTGLDNGYSNVHAPANSLVGMFLDDRLPNSSPAPPALDYTDPASREYTSLTNLQLAQVFFIGDGRARTGPMPTPVTQQITVPAGATALFLGVMDTSGDSWAANAGSFSVTINSVSGGGGGGPPAPTGLHTTRVDVDRVSLAWTLVSDQAASINVQRSQGSSGNFNTLANVQKTDTTYQDDTVVPGTTYVYRLQTVNSGGSTNGTSPDTITVNVPAAPPIVHLSCELVGAPSSVKPGDTLTYDITFNLDASGGELDFATVIDDLPAGTSYVANSATFLNPSTGQPIDPPVGDKTTNPAFHLTGLPDYHDSNPLVFFAGPVVMNPGTTYKMRMQVKVLDNPGVSTISNTYYADGYVHGQEKKVPGPPVSVPVSAPLDVKIDTSPNVVTPGGDVKYLVTVNVNQAGGVKDLTFTDTLPQGAGFNLFKQVLPKPKTVLAYDPVANKVTFNAGTAAAGSKFQFELHLQAPYDPNPGINSELDNAGFLVTGTAAAGALSVNPGHASVLIRLDPNNLTPPVPKLQLIVLATVNDKLVNPLNPTARVGETITYFLHLSNTGNATAKRVILTDTAPAGLTPKLGVHGGSRPQGTANGQSISWLVGDLTPDPQGDFLYTFSVTAAGTPGQTVISHGPAVLTAGDLLNPVTGTPATLGIPVVQPVHFQIQVIPSVNYLMAQNGAEKKITYHVDYANDGGSTAHHAVVQFTPPANAYLTTGGTPPSSSNNGTYTWQLTKTGTLPPSTKAQGQITFVVGTTATSGSIIAQPKIVSDETQAIGTSVVPIYTGARLWVGLRVAHMAQAGDHFTFTIDYGNTGDTAADVVVNDGLPDAASVVRLARGAELYGRTVVQQDTLQPGETKTVSITVTAGPGQLVNHGCSISEAQNQGNAREGRVTAADGTTRYAPAVTTTVVAKGQVKNPLQALWDAIVNAGGSALSWVVNLGKTHPAAQKDVSTIGANSTNLALAGLDVMTWKSGVIVTRTGNGQVVVMAPKGVNVTGAPCVSDDGRVCTYTGSPSAIHIGPDTAQSLLDAGKIVAQGGGNIVAQGGGNIVAQGGGNLITSDGGGLIGHDGASVRPNIGGLIASGDKTGFLAGANNVVVTGLITSDGGGLITSDGAGLITSDGAGLVQVNSGLIVTTSSGKSPGG